MDEWNTVVVVVVAHLLPLEPSNLQEVLRMELLPECLVVSLCGWECVCVCVGVCGWWCVCVSVCVGVCEWWCVCVLTRRTCPQTMTPESLLI